MFRRAKFISGRNGIAAADAVSAGLHSIKTVRDLETESIALAKPP
jgi:hypothetical protein